MDIQKIGASLISQTAEANFGLATLNVDFSVIKLQAPAEYKPLGNELTPSRRSAAEDGMPHVTARKLGALFQDWVPPVPDLVKAYGRRAVEIAQCRSVNPKASKSDGIFADHIGIDGTSIWAAATSGPHAIPVYMLACMLARMWSTTEATSIWTELVSERKQELAAIDETDPSYERAQFTSRISIPREDLAHWEASARSWLQAADRSMVKKQKQLMLIVNNTELPVSTKPQLVENVRSSWRSAMIAIDSLVKGLPQSVQDGAVLLGLSSWHLYPDMVVLGKGPSPVRVEQKDELINPAGLLTIGLNIESSKHHGVYWSLPLSHLRYYGGPVMAERSLATQGNRITVHELFQVSVGSLTRSWHKDRKHLASIIAELWAYIEAKAHPYAAPGTTYWLGYIARAMEPLMNSGDLAKKQCLQLMRYGERHCPNFLAQGKPVPELFGILKLTTLLPLLNHEEDGVEVLRSYAESIGRKDERAYIIQYLVGKGDSKSYSLSFEYATAFPSQRSSFKRNYDGSVIQGIGHVRWVLTQFAKDAAMKEWYYDGSRLERFESMGECTFPIESENISKNKDEKSITWTGPPAMFAKFKSNNSFSAFVDLDGDTDTGLEELDTSQVSFHLVAGDPDRIALYATRPLNESMSPLSLPNQISIEGLSKSLERGSLSESKLLKYLNAFISHESRRNLLSSLRALVTVENIYKMLPNSLIALGVTSQPLFKMPWIPKDHVVDILKMPWSPDEVVKTQLSEFQFSAFSLDIGRTFACIALFDSGFLAVGPDNLSNVLAMATGDSIFIAAALLCDPTEGALPSEVRRVWGSIGKPGIAMLIPPKEPQIREVERDWRVVTHNTFDGKLEDSFQSTTLHLRFTDYILPIDVGSHGNRDFEVYFLESVVSIHDHGEWVADLDILGQLNSPLLRILGNACLHTESNTTNQAVIGNPLFTMVDNWDEILEPPGNPSIVRSAGNWLGRLATMALCLQMGHPTIVLPNRFCWECSIEKWREIKSDRLRVSQATREDGPSSPALSLPESPTQPESGSPEEASSLADAASAVVASNADISGQCDNTTELLWNSELNEWTFTSHIPVPSTQVSNLTISKEDVSKTEMSEEMSDLVVIC
ncbi:hypothetical protein FOPG_16051 [Fusarium oxysporum f. sp. conglutinans race 2 54008]|uniref:Uncharacterized protein n=3 Tax=Fusarium oxysporum f. sp. conglutinans TaxID=100902 RepID=A0A8H6LHM1_FUSOX|nr:hypothetical protein FOXB_06443 [Fusarium oxysporum f. sp. conglutinans Fo5176]EXL67851.1 hypothetical protein FOPG_16051 [Fusarium oxysporum f. sp. conglutinans race 2 54008]KAF6520489.1 hypothetical protein HZS61_016906 [Fusarium oxysporum f. sp. conglutinans]KAI8406676.1 hypothetical protein FOFC_12099 [Fusarium oxysporum]KAF6528703.1 hypothetical protein HZS61_000015 [Fusarium oxysporum f. sp. conglutinans]